MKIVSTSNAYGTIKVSEKAIAQTVVNSVLECYGVVALRNKNVMLTIGKFINRKNYSTGVKIKTVGDRIYIYLSVILKYGISIAAVSQSLRRTVKYDIEKFTGMIVELVEVEVLDVRV